MLSVVALVLLVRVVFDEKFDNFDRYVEERESYEGGTAEFDENFEKMTEWFEQYKKEHPGATDSDAEAAWKEAWGE